MTSEDHGLLGQIEDGIERGLADIAAGQFVEFTPNCAKRMAERFKAANERS